MRKIQDVKDLEGKKVLVRVDYNVPISDGKITDSERIEGSLDTINYLVSKGASVVLLSHLGRPKGKKDTKYSLEIVVPVLEKLTKKIVHFVPDCVGDIRDEAVQKMMPGNIVLLENVRFYPEEEENDKKFSKELAKDMDLYVDDAFSAAHRAHASIVGVTEYLPSYAGLALQEEVYGLSKILKNPQRPFVFVGGGAKISDKLPILENLMKKVDVMLIGGGMANTFLAANGDEIGKSLTEKDCLENAKEIIAKAEKSGVALMLPEDVVVTKKIEDKPKHEEKDIEEVEIDEIIADIGENTVLEYKEIISQAGTIFWNGTLGINEIPEFNMATLEIGKAIANAKGFSVIGGGDTIASLPEKLKEKFDFVSLAGGASLEFMEGKELPGLTVLK